MSAGHTVKGVPHQEILEALFHSVNCNGFAYFFRNEISNLGDGKLLKTFFCMYRIMIHTKKSFGKFSIAQIRDFLVQKKKSSVSESDSPKGSLKQIP